MKKAYSWWTGKSVTSSPSSSTSSAPVPSSSPTLSPSSSPRLPSSRLEEPTFSAKRENVLSQTAFSFVPPSTPQKPQKRASPPRRPSPPPPSPRGYAQNDFLTEEGLFFSVFLEGEGTPFLFSHSFFQMKRIKENQPCFPPLSTWKTISNQKKLKYSPLS